ncbi:Hypothetical predicted protein [Mytilus galloprovincialis]|uniref:Uncharacterized protein n=1 Tax=Mytilus galloprovincialis TaxID=29158 RepID=A0A8B6HR51_MYTGA|nr:Hypothetical predicted protein [Mytilus galloprovincialis]
MSFAVENNAGEPLLSCTEDNDEVNPNSTGYGSFEGKPRFTRKKLFIVGCIMMSELCERSVCIVPIFGGYLADAFVGKCKMVLGCGLIYVIVLLQASAVYYKTWFGPYNGISSNKRRGFYFSSLVLIVIGAGGIKATVGPFGAQQVENIGPKAVRSFFSWLYWFMNIGAIIAYSGVAAIQQDVGFDVGFLVPLISMIIALVIFVLNKSNYISSPATGIGMIFAALSMFAAGGLEICRKNDISIIGQQLAGQTFNASSISVFAQVPQFILIGASEVFTSISGLEFAYSQAPVFMQGVCMGLFLATGGIGGYLAELILVIVDAATGSQPPGSWFPDEINDGKTEYLFFSLGILMFINFFIFAIVTNFYKYRNQDNYNETCM